VVGFGSEMGQAAERRLSLAVGEHTWNPMVSAATGDGGASRLSQQLSQHNQPLQHAGIDVDSDSQIEHRGVETPEFPSSR
jgi:hypothetical protein